MEVAELLQSNLRCQERLKKMLTAIQEREVRERHTIPSSFLRKCHSLTRICSAPRQKSTKKAVKADKEVVASIVSAMR
jgi:hypothetical protein